MQREPGIAGSLNTLYRRQGTPPLFDDAGNLARDPTIADAEHLTRMLGETAENLRSPTNPSASRIGSSAVADLQANLRAAVEAQAPQLSGPRRATAEAIAAEVEGYPLGRKALTQPPEEFGVGYGDLAAPGQEAARAGAATALRARATKGRTPNTLIDELLGDRFPDRTCGR